MLGELKGVVLFMLHSENTCKELCDMACTSERPMLPPGLITSNDRCTVHDYVFCSRAWPHTGAPLLHK